MPRLLLSLHQPSLTIFSFTAVMLGLPKHIMEDDVQCEYPVDTDDENVSEHGFQASLPGESTKLSSALALFRAARILSKVLVEVFPARASYDLSFKSLSDLSDELDSWNASLAPHLRLQFAQDKPSTGTISSRSPLLSLTYHYIRALIHRPAVSASIGNRSSSSLIAMASSSKHMVQIVELLEERSMCFSFCVNKDELLILSGFGLMFQGLKLEPTSKMLKDNQKMSRAVVHLLHKSRAPCATEFDHVLHAFMPSQATTDVSPPPLPTPKPTRVAISRHNSDSAVVITDSPPSLPSSARKQLKAMASRFTANTKTPQLIPRDRRRATLHNISLHPDGPPGRNSPSLQPSNLFKTAPTSQSEPARSPINLYSRPVSTTNRPSAPPHPKAQPTKSKSSPSQQIANLNLDYLSFGGENEVAETQPPSRASEPVKTEPQPTDWEKLLGSLDNGPTNIYDACYGGRPVEALLDSPSRSSLLLPHSDKSGGGDDSQSTWTSADIWSLCQTESTTTIGSIPTVDSGHADSIISFSSAEDASGDGAGRNSDDFAYADWVTVVDGSKAVSSSGNTTTRGIVMPAGVDDEFTLGGQWENSLVL